MNEKQRPEVRRAEVVGAYTRKPSRDSLMRSAKHVHVKKIQKTKTQLWFLPFMLVSLQGCVGTGGSATHRTAYSRVPARLFYWDENQDLTVVDPSQRITATDVSPEGFTMFGFSPEIVYMGPRGVGAANTNTAVKIENIESVWDDWLDPEISAKLLVDAWPDFSADQRFELSMAIAQRQLKTMKVGLVEGDKKAGLSAQVEVVQALAPVWQQMSEDRRRALVEAWLPLGKSFLSMASQILTGGSSSLFELLGAQENKEPVDEASDESSDNGG